MSVSPGLIKGRCARALRVPRRSGERGAQGWPSQPARQSGRENVLRAQGQAVLAHALPKSRIGEQPMPRLTMCCKFDPASGQRAGAFCKAGCADCSVALGSRPAPEHLLGSDRPGHAEPRAVGSRCPEYPHAPRSGHLHRSPPAQSEASAARIVIGRLSPKMSGSSRSTRITTLDDSRRHVFRPAVQGARAVVFSSASCGLWDPTHALRQQLRAEHESTVAAVRVALKTP